MSKKTKKPVTKKKSVKKLPVIIGSFICVALIVVIVVVANIKNPTIDELCKNTWIPKSAHNASGDEVEMSEVYNTVYSSYQGSMSFADDGTFSLWLSPGTPDDGTHGGKYSVEDSKIEAIFDDGTQTEFDIKYEMNSIESITVYYDKYEVIFVKQ